MITLKLINGYAPASYALSFHLQLLRIMKLTIPYGPGSFRFSGPGVKEFSFSAYAFPHRGGEGTLSFSP